MFGFGKKKIDKAAWAALVFSEPPKHPEKLSEEQLSALTTMMLMQHHRIIMDSVQLVANTRNPETRQGRTDLSYKHYKEMVKFKPYCNEDQLAMIHAAEEAMKAVSLKVY